MEYVADLSINHPDLLTLDPCRYVREADAALRSGNREAAVALIQQAFLAFDLVAGNCDDFKGTV